MDLFGDDIDSLLRTDDDDNELNDNIRENSDAEENGDDEKTDDKNENDERKVVEPKKRSVRNPQLRLNVERLKSDRGIHTLEKYCTTLKFHGKGHEKEDLNNLMKRLEHWAHRLYPNYKFDDFVGAVEKLGKKKEMQTHMYRYRQGLLEEVANKNTEQEGNEDDANSLYGNDEPIDELDEIIEQQIQNYTMAPKTPAHDRTFDSIRSSMIASPKLREQNPVEASTPIVHKAMNLDFNNAVRMPSLTSEQMAKIAENRRIAQERLRKKQMEAANANNIINVNSEILE